MLRYTCALLSVLVAVNATYHSYGTKKSSYSAPTPSYSQVVIPAKPSVLYNIPAPAHWNYAPASYSGPSLLPVDAHHISGYSKPSALIGAPTHPKANAAAASANVPLHPGNYKLLVVPSYEVPNIVGPEPALPVHYHSHSDDGYGAYAGGYAAHSSY